MPLETEKLKFILDLAQLDQSRVYVAKTSGKKFLEFECIPTPNGRDGQTHFITQRQTKEERLAKVRLPILGNIALAFPPQAGTTHQSGPSAASTARQQPAPSARPQPTENELANQGGDIDPNQVPF